MPFVYRYTDADDGIVKYIGISKNKETLINRIRSHKNDSVGTTISNPIVEILEVRTLCDAHALEGHFISEYRTGDYLNSAKIDWGICTFAPLSLDLNWMDFDEYLDALSHKKKMRKKPLAQNTADKVADNLKETQTESAPTTSSDKQTQKRYLSCKEMCEYTGLKRVRGVSWCEEIGAKIQVPGLRKILFDRLVIDSTLEKSTVCSN